MKKLGIIFFLYGFIVSILNIQQFLTHYISTGVGQSFAYLNLVLLVLGSLIFLKEDGVYSTTAKTWIFFYITYYAFGLVASITFDRLDYIPQTIVPVVYFFGFFIFLKTKKNQKIFFNTLLVTLFISSVFLVVFYHIGYDVGSFGPKKYGIDRAEGLFGDANNSALIAIITYILFHKFYNPKLYLIKFMVLVFIAYSIFLTFSTTGLFIFVLVNLLINYKFFTKEKIFIALFLLPILYFVIINLTQIASSFNLREAQYLKVKNLENLLTFNLEEVDSSGRTGLLNTLLNFVYENPFIGNGIGFGNTMRGHNTIVGIWADAGIVPLIAFFILLGVYFNKIIRSSADKRYYILAVFLTFLIFMTSLQTVINQPYIVCIFIYLGYVLDEE
ncbi:hypothetical protein HCG49_11105 [Arenibacter sp. 6A1]|uniref:O-antigen ligase family protein n=1 Tax=Arenibacter sp. 6A1 TaxID=2720391 RepID=UPI001446E324|nr:hypothetical protein [Arenibacter sp. 6A1]NKI27112.1 hypothetical protein [Arenibacter sp. 6A1]